MESHTKFFRNGFCKLLLSTIAAISLTISSFGGESRLAAQTPIIKNIQTAPSARTGISNKDMQNICTAAIATLFDKPTSIINVESIETGSMHLSSTLPVDSTLRQYTCKIEGNKILWTNESAASPTDKSDEQVTFRLTNDEILITVTFPDGSQKESRFPR